MADSLTAQHSFGEKKEKLGHSPVTISFQNDKKLPALQT